MNNRPRPPAIAEWFLGRILAPVHRDYVLRDLNEEFTEHIVPSLGLHRARLWYWLQVVRSIPVVIQWHRGEIEMEKEKTSRASSVPSDLLRDLRFAVRNIIREPSFALVVVATLALGIGANTAIFSVVHGVVLRPLPYPEPARIVQLWQWQTVSQAVLERVRAETSSFTDVSGYYELRRALSGEGEPEELFGAAVSPNHFRVLGTKPFLGRLLHDDEAQPGRGNVVVLSHALWQRRFGTDPDIVGRRIDLAGTARTVVGVLPKEHVPIVPGFSFWIPETIDRSDESAYGGMARTLLLARLRPGVTVEQASEDVSALARRIHAEAPASSNEEWVRRARAMPLRGAMVTDVRAALWMLLGAVAFVLMIASANVANLLLARASRREREIAMRLGLGAGRGRIVRQLLTESAVLGLIGGSGGVGLAVLIVNAMTDRLPSGVPRADAIVVDGVVLAFALCVSLLSSFAFGIVPALLSSRKGLVQSLRDGGRSATSSIRRHRLNGALVAAEMALSVILVAGAGLMLRSFAELSRVDPGFEPARVLTMRVRIPASAHYEESASKISFFEEVREVIRGLPRVESSGFVSFLPMATRGRPSSTYRIPERPLPEDVQPPFANFQLTTPGYFESMGIPLLRGRVFDGTEHEGTPLVGVINATMARDAFGDEDPLGRQIDFFGGGAVFSVIGVVGDSRQRRPDEPPRPEVFLSYAQQNWTSSLFLVVRSMGDPDTVATSIQSAIWSIEPEAPISDLRTMNDVLSRATADSRFFTVLLTAFGALALLLAAIGVYGVLSYLVGQRTQEFGIRIALGANPTRVSTNAMRRGLTPVLVGIAIGVAGALVTTRFLESLLFQVSSTDRTTFFAVPILLVLVALVASYLPARRVARTAPSLSLGAD